jgi:glycerophosphoryl diester phosphodiesterase
VADRRQVLRFGAVAAVAPALAGATTVVAEPALATEKPDPALVTAKHGGGNPPCLVVGHRGASGYRPEHT